MLVPLIFFENPNTGTSCVELLRRYCCVKIPPTVFSSTGLPNILPPGIAEFRIERNCSYQFVFVLSFQPIVVLAKLTPEESITDSVVETAVIFNKPEAGMLRFGA